MPRTIIACADCEGTREQLDRVWDVICTREIKVNFFFTGETAAEHSGLVQNIARSQNVDSHTWSHPNLRSLGREAQRAEIRRGRDMVEQVIGRATRGFRAPYHAINRDTVTVLNEEGFEYDLSGLYFRYDMGAVREIRPSWFREWTELYGWLRISPQRAWGIVRTLFRICDPLVIPIHPQYTGRDRVSAAALDAFAVWAKERGGEFVFVPEYLSDENRGDSHGSRC